MVSKKSAKHQDQDKADMSGAAGRPGDEDKADAIAADAASEIDRALKDEQADREAVDNELMSIRSELDEAKDRVLRLSAELENYRKRVARQKEEDLLYANTRLIRDMLPVMDNMNRAIEAAEKTNNAEGLLQGCRLVAQLMQGVLKQHQCKPIEALNQPFDPHLHEAVGQQACDELPPGTVLGEVQTGYRLHDRVVRPSRVIVSKAAEENEEA